jgi:hypothetical protein
LLQAASASAEQTHAMREAFIILIPLFLSSESGPSVQRTCRDNASVDRSAAGEMAPCVETPLARTPPRGTLPRGFAYPFASRGAQ